MWIASLILSQWWNVVGRCFCPDYTVGESVCRLFYLWVSHIVHKEVLSCVWYVQVSTSHLHPQIYSVKKESVCDKKWLNADLILSLSEQETETERERRVCEDYFHHLPSQGLLMEESTWGRVCVSVWVCVGNELIHCSGQNWFLFSFGEYDTNLVIYTIAVSPGELWATEEETKLNHGK